MEKGREHDHSAKGEEEVYAVVGGSGTVLVDGEEIAVRPGHFVFCSPDARRQMVPVVTGSSGSGSAQPAAIANCNP
jgi:quercetin dioxygenase-like cupin family protein